jgi:hypothetical protein
VSCFGAPEQPSPAGGDYLCDLNGFDGGVHSPPSLGSFTQRHFFFSLRPSMGVRGLMLLAMPSLAMAMTLPQAVVLWTEPDVPEEARV